MSTPPSLAHLPQLVVVGTSSHCGCGDTIDRGERAGEADDRGRLRCLRCMAALQAQGRTPAGTHVIAATAAGSAARTAATLGAEHAARVSRQAELLLNRMAAARALGTLVHELRPLTISDR